MVNNSLGLVSDAGHMLFDSSALVIGLVASYMAEWPANDRYSLGYKRVEVLSGFVNGVFLVFVLAIGQVTPPVGLCLFVACDIGKVSIEKISREVLPYVGGLIVTAILLVLFPQIVPWLPSLTKMA